MRGTLPLFLALLLSAACHAQEPWRLGTRAHYGFLWPHRPSSWILVEGHAPAVELFAERKVSGIRQWHRAYAMPSYGAGVLYTGMANPDRIGASVRVLPYLFLPLKSPHFGLRIGWGVGWISQPFDRRDNGKQIGIGSRVNTAIQIMPEYRYEKGRLSFLFGLGIDHWSNGSFKLPNLGLNYLSASLGACYGFGRPDFQCGTWAPDTARSCEWSIVASAFKSETARPLSGQYSVYSLVGQRQWQISRKSHLVAGADAFNKGALATVHPELKEKGRADYTQVGVHGGYALGFGRGELFIHMGAYVYSPVQDEAPLFHRVGMRYRTGEHLVWNVSLKSHYAVADHWEFGVGYRWN